MNPLRVIARKSALSLAQVREAFTLLPSITYNLETIDSYGDLHKELSLMSASVADDFFTRELDEALLSHRADVAVHSAKDLPYPMPAGLEVFALLASADISKTDSLVSRNKMTLKDLPAGACVGTSSTARKAELLQYRPDVEVISIRGTIEERIAQVDSGAIDALIVATCALQRLDLEHRIAETLPFRTHPLQGNLAIVGREGDTTLKAIFEAVDVRRGYGHVTLVGFGPGNPDLLTLGGDKALSAAEVIFHDALTDSDFLARYKAEKIFVGKRKNRHSHSQDTINEMIYQAALAGRQTVRLKGGDPMIFAHGREEIDYLQSRMVSVNVIAGISAAVAASALTHIPLTHRGISSSVAFITGHTADNASLQGTKQSDNKAVPSADTLVYYMGGSNISSIAQSLTDAGWDAQTPVALAYNVSLPDMKVFYSTLGELRFSTVKYPTPLVVIAGQVVKFEKHAAAAQNVLVTATTTGCYTGDGKIIHTPLIKIERNHNIFSPVCSEANYIIFTSRYGVQYFFELLEEAQIDIRTLSNAKFFSVGKTTTVELKKHHIYPDLESPTESAEGLINYFRNNGITGTKILLPRSDKALPILPEALTAMGNNVTDLPVYTNTINDQTEKIDLSKVHKIIFASPSGVEAFKKLYGALPEGIPLIAKGKTTENALKTYASQF